MVAGRQDQEENKRNPKNSKMKKAKCKICRRAKTKLFLKGDKCTSPKCPMVVKPYAPGVQGKRTKGFLSEYGVQLRETQKLRQWYNLKEGSLKKYVRNVLTKRGKVEDAQSLLIQNLEKRLDNVVYRLGFAVSRIEARQLVTHGHFLINGKKNNIPSCSVKNGDVISLKESSKKRKIFQEAIAKLSKSQLPGWLKLDIKKLEGTVMGDPSLGDVTIPVEISSIFEFYSR